MTQLYRDKAENDELFKESHTLLTQRVQLDEVRKEARLLAAQIDGQIEKVDAEMMHLRTLRTQLNDRRNQLLMDTQQSAVITGTISSTVFNK